MQTEKAGFEKYVVFGIIGLVVILFTLFGFFIKQPCDIDEVNLYCRLHPASIIQIIGVVGFYLSAFIISGSWGKWLTLWNPENSTRWNWIFFIIALLSILMMWFG